MSGRKPNPGHQRYTASIAPRLASRCRPSSVPLALREPQKAMPARDYAEAEAREVNLTQEDGDMP